MKTSTWIILGILGYLWYKNQPSVSGSSNWIAGPLPMGPPAPVIGPPTPFNDPCNGLSSAYNPDMCGQQGRNPYYPMD